MVRIHQMLTKLKIGESTSNFSLAGMVTVGSEIL